MKKATINTLLLYSAIFSNFSFGMTLPFESGETWYICQGYRGTISHTGGLSLSLDLSISAASVGPTGCTPGTSSASNNQAIISPVSGNIAWIGSSDPSIICLNYTENNQNKSLKMGHILAAIEQGDGVIEGQTQIGTLRPHTDALTGNYAHIHMQKFIGSNCTGTATDFGNDFGINLSSDINITNQWKGTALTRASLNLESWESGAYGNNVVLSEELSIPTAPSLAVTVTGETEEGYDFLGISDSRGVLISSLSGKIAEKFVVHDNSITARLVSDSSITKEGVTVAIQDATSTDNSKWITGVYPNNYDHTEELRIPNATSLLVRVIGETEKHYDILQISDESNTTIRNLDGVINESFILNGNSIKARLISDGSVQESGIVISITPNDGGF